MDILPDIPAFAGLRKRQALARASRTAGFNVIAI
jgi:hypothetical protein